MMEVAGRAVLTLQQKQGPKAQMHAVTFFFGAFFYEKKNLGGRSEEVESAGSG